ncbi:MAG: DUF5916 domain-containing protein [Longimicrobiales bacterium]
MSEASDDGDVSRGSRPLPAMGRTGIAVAAVALGWAWPVAAQEANASTQDLEAIPRPTLVIREGPRVSIDGRLDEAVWGELEPITDFVQAEPMPGAPPSERTEMYVFHDRENLYIGAELYDRDPSGIVVRSLERDSPGILFEEMDAVGIALDTFLDRRTSFLFFVNASGGIKDGQGFDNGRTRDYGWDGVVEVRTRIHERGWTMEMAIPWKTLRFDPTLEEQAWGLNLMRRIRRRNEVSYWAPLDRRNRIFLMSLAGTMRGMGELPAPGNLTVKPYALAARSSGANLQADGADYEPDAGADLKWGITPSLTLDLTWRTDFSQVEADQEQVNLTRFPLFFPEQRDFFLENSGTFTFGDVNGGPGSPRSGSSLRDFTLFHSREIGLKGGAPVPLFGGARLTGRVGDLEVGALNVQSESYEGDPAENFTVLRVRRSIMGDSDVGAIVTNRQATGVQGGGAFNRTFGVDANLRLVSSLFVNSYVVGMDTDEGSDQAARLAVGWRDRFWNASAGIRHIGEAFDPGIGFVRRAGIREAYGTVGAHHRPTHPNLFEINPFVEFTRQTDLDGVLLTRLMEGGLGFDFADRSRLDFAFTNRFEYLDRSFSPNAGTVIPVDDYDWSEGSVRYSSSQAQAFSGSVNVSGGGYYGGRRVTVSGSTRWQPTAAFIVETSATHNSVEVQGDSFSADVYATRARYAFSTRFYLGAFVQYNAARDELVSNLRAQLIHAPLSDLYLLFTERRSTALDTVLERFVTLKATRLLAF